MPQVSIIGFGKIGQAVAANILQQGTPVLAIDRNPAIAQSFQDGSYQTNEPGLREVLMQSWKQGLLQIRPDYASLKESRALIIAIPLLINDDKSIRHEPFAECFREFAPYLHNNTVIVIETSMPVGYSRQRVAPVLEAAGLQHGRDFLLAYSPERIKSGTMLEQLQAIPKVIGGLTGQAAEAAYQLYAPYFPEGLLHRVESIEAAELLKLSGMIYRDINIAVANQLAQFASRIGVNFADLIPLVNTDREANLLQPGIGVGGHCTPVYPYFLMENFKEAGLDFTLAQHSRMINNQMVEHAFSLIKNKAQQKTALILGLSFRPNVKEDTLSTTYLLQEVLTREGYHALVHDTEFSTEEIAQRGFEAATGIYENDVETVFLVTMHREYEQLDFARLAASGVKFFVDGRNSIARANVEAAGIVYFGIGR